MESYELIREAAIIKETSKKKDLWKHAAYAIRETFDIGQIERMSNAEISNMFLLLNNTLKHLKIK